MPDLPTIWFGILLLEIALYIMLDGADLGIGVLSLLPQPEGKRSLMMHTIGPIWDANETWLIIAAGTLWGAFPLAYSVLLNALYIPVFILLFGIVFRAVSFEFREHSAHKKFWSRMFGLASLLTVIGQGCALGGILNGIAIDGRAFAGGAWDWLSPLTIFTTLGVVGSYAVVGYAYLLKKTDYELASQSFLHIIVAAAVSFVGFFVATLMLPQLQGLLLARWSDPTTALPLFGIGAVIGLLGLLLIYYAWRRIHRERLHGLCLAIFMSSMAGLLIGVYPYLIPPTVTLYDAAASPQTLTFMLWGIGPLLPIVLAYNYYLYRVFSRSPRDTSGAY